MFDWVYLLFVYYLIDFKCVYFKPVQNIWQIVKVHLFHNIYFPKKQMALSTMECWFVRTLIYHIDKIFKQHLTKDAGKNVNCRILIYLKTFEHFEKSVIGINFYWLAKTNQKVSGNLSLFQNVLSSLIVKLLSATLLSFVLN